MSNGWIKVHRKFTKWEWYTDVPVKVLFLHLLLEANHEGKRWRGREVERGQCVVGRTKLAEETGLSERQIRTALDKLKKTGEIRTESTNRFTLVTIVNYALYQAYDDDYRPTDGQQATNKRPTDDQQATTNKNDKNVKNDKNIRILSDFEGIIRLYNETCPSLPQVRSISESRKRAIRARMNVYTTEDFKTLFEKAEASDFLKGSNNRNWVADFDWLIKDGNMPKVLEGKYDNREKRKDEWQFTDFI